MKGKGKKNAVMLGGGEGRWVPVADCIAATGSLVMVGCGRWNGGGKIVWGLRRMWGAMEER